MAFAWTRLHRSERAPVYTCGLVGRISATQLQGFFFSKGKKEGNYHGWLVDVFHLVLGRRRGLSFVLLEFVCMLVAGGCCFGSTAAAAGSSSRFSSLRQPALALPGCRGERHRVVHHHFDSGSSRGCHDFLNDFLLGVSHECRS